jgi:hypothetical protein
MDDNTNLAMFNQAILLKEITWWQMELPSGDVIFGDSKNEMLGYPKEQFKTYQDFTKLVHPDDYEKIMKAMYDLLEGRAQAYETTYRIKSSKNEYLVFYDYGRIISKTDEKTTVIGFVMKIKSLDNITSEITSFKNMLNDGSSSIINLITKLQTDTP